MAPKYQLYGGFTVKDALAKAGAPTNKFPFQDGEPPVDFFTHPPENSAAVFSTLFGRRPFRSVENPTDKRNGHYWWAAEIQRVCDELRRNLPDVCRKIETPRNYWDLYKYFDAYDIYYRGAQNLWNVINTFVFENEYAAEVVWKEQQIQTEQYMPLFESLASELLRKADIQTRLLTWDREKQWDVLKLLTPYELQIFEGYEKYPDHFLEAIRDIFVKHCDGLLKKPCSLDSSLAPVDRRIPNMSISKRRAALRHYLQSPEALEDPFMDKFEIPNKIINGIVIADGTSQTAARKAKYKGTSLLTSNRGQQGVEQNNTRPPLTGIPAQNVNSFPVESREGGVARRVFTTERCSSAPSIGGNPANIISGSATNQARVYPGDSHEVNKKLVGGQDPAVPKGTSEGIPSTTNTFQVAMPTPNSHLPQIPTASNQVLPPVLYHDDPRLEGSHIRHSPTRQPKPAYATHFVPGMVSPYQAPDAQGLDTSHGPFAHQIPPYAVPQQHMQGAPPPTWQPQHSHQAHTQRNSRGYIPNVNLPYYQTESGQQFDSSESFQRQRRMSSTQSHGSGRWQHTGSDDIHGPKVIYCKGGVQSQESQSHRAGHWSGRNRNDSARRPSTASIGGNYPRPNNAHPQHYSTHSAPHQIDRGTTKMGNNLRASANLGNSPSAYACVNASKICNIHVKFDPCLCGKCSDRDRTLFVSRLKEGINQDAGALEHLKQHFSKFGPVEKVTSVGPGGTAVYVRFAHAQYAVAAVHTEPFVQIGGIGEAPLKVDFRTGSQFHVPLSEHRGRGPNNRFFSADNAPQEPRLIMPQSPLKDSNTFNTHPNSSQYQSPIPEEQVRPSGGTAPEGQLPGANPNTAGKRSIDPTDRTVTQSGFGMETTRPSHAALGHQTFGSQSTNGPASIDAVLHETANTQPQDSRYDRILSCGSTQELARNIAGLDYDVMSPRRENHYNSLNDLMQPGSKERQTAIGPSSVQDSLARLPENEDEEASIDYGTVRIRPGKARYVAIPPAWRQESISIRNPHEPGSQTLRTASPNDQEPSAKAACKITQPTLPATQGGRQAQTTECRAGEIATQTERQSDEEKVSSDDANRDASTHTKRKASETEGGEKAPGQPSPKKKFAKPPQPDDPAQEVQISKSGDHQYQGRVGDTGPSKASKKKKNKNKNRRSQAAEPAVPKEAPTAALYEAQTFKPAIAGYDLPPYPRQDVPWTKSGCGVLWYSNHDFNSHANRLNENEPFPAYRDLMSGPQLPFKGHKSHASGPSRSISSTTSTVIQAVSKLNPGAQNFVPTPPVTSPRSTSVFDPQASSMPSLPEETRASRFPGHLSGAAQDPRFRGTSYSSGRGSFGGFGYNTSSLSQPPIQRSVPLSHVPYAPIEKGTDGSKEKAENSRGGNGDEETALKAGGGKENNGSRAVAGAKKDGGKRKGKSKNGKGGRSGQNSISQASASIDRKAEPSKPSGSKGAVPKKVPAPGDQNVEGPKPRRGNSADEKRHAAAEPQQNTSPKHDEKAKGKEISAPKKQGTETTSTSTPTASPKSDKSEGRGLKHTKSRTDPAARKTSDTTPRTSPPRPKQGKAKQRAPKKGSSPQPGSSNAKTDARSQPVLSADDFPALPSQALAAKKTTPPLAPIPLPGAPWRLVSRTRGPRADVEAEKGLPDGERKGG